MRIAIILCTLGVASTQAFLDDRNLRNDKREARETEPDRFFQSPPAKRGAHGHDFHLAPRSAPGPNSAPPAPSGPGAPSEPGSLSSAPASPGDPIITIGGHEGAGSHVGGATLAANSDGAYVFSSQTLERGSAVTLQGTTYSLARDGKALVVNGQTSKITQGAGGKLPNFALSTPASSSGAFSSSSAYPSSSSAYPSSSSAYPSSSESFSPGPSSTGSSGQTTSADRGTTTTTGAMASAAASSSSAPSAGGGGGHVVPSLVEVLIDFCVVALTAFNLW